MDAALWGNSSEGKDRTVLQKKNGKDNRFEKKYVKNICFMAIRVSDEVHALMDNGFI